MTGNDPMNNQREVLTKRAFRDDRLLRMASTRIRPLSAKRALDSLLLESPRIGSPRGLCRFTGATSWR